VSEIAHRLGLSQPTICYHARKLGYPPSEKFSRRYDWTEVQRHYDEGHSMRECRAKFGFSSETWHSAVKRGDIVPRPAASPLEKYLVKGRRVSRFHLKRRLMATGLKPRHCELCGINEWQGRPLSLALHHVNGDGHDNRLDNLQILCPNCHSQTPNFGSRNPRRARTLARARRMRQAEP
jgi:hypothetical protein